MLPRVRKFHSNPIPSTNLWIYFSIHKKVEFGESLYVSGNVEELGNWDPKNAIRLEWR